jgi:hypothetical protein
MSVCDSALIIAGEHHWCDQRGTDHSGWPHANKAAQAVWDESVDR